MIMLYIRDCIVASSAHTANGVIPSEDTEVGTVSPEGIINLGILFFIKYVVKYFLV